MSIHDIYFLARHTPFWAVPLVVLGAEFGYMFWLKKKKKSAYFCAMLILIGALSTSFYIWAGGPEKSVKIIKKWHRDNQ
jgi:hypothetical protein